MLWQIVNYSLKKFYSAGPGRNLNNNGQFNFFLYFFEKCYKIKSLVIYKLDKLELTSGLYYKLMMIVNDNSRVVNKLEASLTDDARVVIYNRHMFIVQATGSMKDNRRKPKSFLGQVFNSKLSRFVILCICMAYTSMPKPRSENSAQVLSC